MTNGCATDGMSVARSLATRSSRNSMRPWADLVVEVQAGGKVVKPLTGGTVKGGLVDFEGVEGASASHDGFDVKQALHSGINRWRT